MLGRMQVLPARAKFFRKAAIVLKPLENGEWDMFLSVDRKALENECTCYCAWPHNHGLKTLGDIVGYLQSDKWDEKLRAYAELAKIGRGEPQQS